MAGRPFGQLADFLAMVPWCVTHPAYVKDVYFCLGRQANVGPMLNGRAKALRNQPNTTHVKAIWLDVDVKDKAYRTLEDALDAVIAFVAAIGLPQPSALVASGGGLQIYWISDVALTVAEWQPYAEGLKSLAIKHGLKCDAGLTTDCCRVLRVPGTVNFKYSPPRPVKILALGAMYDFKKDLALLPTVAPTLPHGNTPIGTTTKLCYNPANFPQLTPLTDPDDSLAAGLTTHDDTPLDFFSMAPQCPFFLDAIQTGGKDHPQGLWHLSVLAATFFKDGEKLAHKLSYKYPSYTKEETQAMWERKVADRAARGLGWPSCRSIESEGSKWCASCIHNGKIRSPLNLAERVQPPAPPPPPAPVVPVVLPANAITPADLPDGYVIDPSTGYIGFVVKKASRKEGDEGVDEFHPLFRCILYKPWAEKNPNGLHFMASMDKGHVKKITIPQVAFASTQAMCLTLANQGVNFAPPNKEGLCNFMSSFLEKLHKAQEATSAVPFGWVTGKDGKEEGFAYAGSIFTRKGQPTRPGGTGDQTLRHYYEPKGKLDPWLRALKVITAQHRPEIEIIAAASFAAPLMRFTGQYSAVLSAYSQSGSNKSTSVKVGLAVWGHPKHTKEVASTTPKSLIVKLSDTCNLPVYWDEIYEDAKMEKVGGTVCEVTEGKGPGTLRPDRTQRETGSWQSCLVVCSNMSLFDHLIRRNKSNSAAINRIFELLVPAATPLTPGRMGENEAENLMMPLEDNYGQMGLIYSQVIAADPDATRKLVNDTDARFGLKVKKQDNERFWMALCTTIIAGANIANHCGASFNVEEIEDCLVKAYLTMRAKLQAEPVLGNTYDYITSVLIGFLKAYGDQAAIWTMDVAGKGKAKQELVYGPDRRYAKGIHIQWVIKKRLLRLSKNELNKWLDAQKGHSWSMAMDGLEKFYNMQKPLPNMNMCAGTDYGSGGPEQLIVIPVPPGSWLDDGLLSKVPVNPSLINNTIMGQTSQPTGGTP